MQASQLSAKVAIQAFCNALQLLELPTLSAEAVRQSKFGTAQVAPLWRVLHDCVLWCLAGGNAGQPAAAALSGLWTEVAEEQLLQAEDGSNGQPSIDIGQEGRDTVLCQLVAWGCPATLVHRLQSGHASSRQLLLALVWLTARFNIFDQALQKIALPVEAHVLLPPYPEDTRCNTASQQCYASAVRSASAQMSAAADHLQRLCQQAVQLSTHNQQARTPQTRTGLRPRDSAVNSSSQDRCEPGPEAEQQMWQAVDAASNVLASTLGRTRAALMSLQSHMDAITRLQDKVRATQHSTWAGRPSTLSAFQLSLLQQPAVLQQHCEALTAATQVLQQQTQLVDSARTFYLWAVSVIQEEARAHPATANRDNTSPQETAGVPKASAQAPSALASLASLPAAGSQPAAALLQRLHQQLTGALSSAQPALTYLQGRKPGKGAVITAQHFRDLARAALRPASSDAACEGLVAGPTAPSSTFKDTIAANGTKSIDGDGASIDGSGAGIPGWALPPDISAAMAAVQQAYQQKEAQNSSWMRAQQLYRLGSVSCSSAVMQGQPAGSDGANAASEANRLMDLTLTVAKALAHTRSSHRQALSAAATALQQDYMVVGLT